MMGIQCYPVVLVHGWKSHPGVWNTFIPHLKSYGIPVWNFSHADMRDPCLANMAGDLQGFIRAMRGKHRYQGEIDIICHCMGTCISRYLLEVMDGSARFEQVRNLIGLGPPNNGSSIAELFLDAEYGSDIRRQLA